ncbi:TonB-dependent receptor [Gammaproteobacteria bacterium]|nr:TonB-dependent receptor [Gammaproteobacteria bacterium]
MFGSKFFVTLVSFMLIFPVFSEDIEEIVVTALKRSSTVVDTPASITAIGANEIEDKGINDMNDLKHLIPSMNFTSVLGAQNITIRGIGQFNGNPGVSVSTDGVFQSRAHSSQLGEMDLERIEVLRGPQGTLYGRNSIGGVVNLITKNPSQETDGYIKLGYSDYNTTKVETAFGGGITENTTYRLVLSSTDQGEGYYDCLNAGCGEQAYTDKQAYRLKVNSELSDNISADIMLASVSTEGTPNPYGWISDNRALSTAFGIPQLAAQPISLKPHEIYQTPTSESVNGTNMTDREYDVSALTLSIDTDFGTIKSVTATQEFNDQFNLDRDGTAAALLDTFDISETETFTQEINLNIERDAMSLVFGGFYMDDETSRHTHFDNPQPVLGFPVPSQFDFKHLKMNTESKAYFADGTFDLSDTTRLSLGLRRTTDEFTSKQDNFISILMPAPVIAAQTCLREVVTEYSSTTSRAVLQHDLSEGSNVYASVSEGFKAGGYATYECTDAYNPEEVTSLEFGFKGSLSESTSLNASIFRYDYSDFQVLQVIGIQTVTRNAGDATVNGLEIEAVSEINDSLSVTTGLTFLDATYGAFENVNGVQPELGVQQLEGNYLSNSPKVSLNVGLNYFQNIESGGSITYRANASYKSKMYFSEFNEFPQSAYTIVDLNVIWESTDETLRSRFFVKNLTDEDYISGYLSSATGGGRFGQWGTPRVYGVEISRNF